MPKCGSQCYLCDLPIRFDTYVGCSHNCEYCFARKKEDISVIESGESATALLNFIKGARGKETNWADWNIPIHWGGMSDPFQPVERERGASYECLKVFAETQYPFVVSSKGALMGERKYLDVLRECNGVFQVSLVCRSYDRLERGAPCFDDRLKLVEKLAGTGRRVIVRIQPYMTEVYDEVYANLALFRDAGAYGVILEGMKFYRAQPGLIKVGGDLTYPLDVITKHVCLLRDRAHELGLKFYSGENRTRRLGDSLTCCGIDGLEGFRPNTFNLNHILNGDKPVPTEAQKRIGTAECFCTLGQTVVIYRTLTKQSFSLAMVEYYKKHRDAVNRILGVTRT